MKICVGLSGGVDSSVAALLLKQQGYDVFAMFMQNWHDTEGTLHGDCEWEEDKFVAEMVARRIGIPFYFVDLSAQYRQRVVDYMFSEYEKGRTPNPDVLCNREIKFDAFLEAARKLGATHVATGHYCRKRENPDGTFSLLEGVDPGKDQSYFLCQLSQEQLSAALFPIGDLCKDEVRRLATEADLPSAQKKDSQGICFVGKVDLPVFLQQKLKSVEGDIVEVYDKFYEDSEFYNKQMELLSAVREAVATGRISDISDETLEFLSRPVTYETIAFETETYRSGHKHIKKTRNKVHPWAKVVGKHDGAQFFTLGQRKGLRVGGHEQPLFVIETDVARNIVYVGEGEEHKGLYRSVMKLDLPDVHYIRPCYELHDGDVRRVRVRIRYRQPLQGAALIMRPSGLFVVFDEPQRSITPGQFAAVYLSEDDERKLPSAEPIDIEAPELILSAVI
ncbi:MAG: tRNA 2-thiouridine(34) synthase MnmA [Bacteroidales bacterium]|nr:tRNA 2-thiouridine(34) synthase MnmA [Bacteroidales bacterium]